MKHKYKFNLLLFFFFGLLLHTHVNAIAADKTNTTISYYHAIFIPLYTHNNSEEVIAIRQFKKDATLYFLVVNPETFDTKIDAAKNFNTKSLSSSPLAKRYLLFKNLANTQYLKALEKYTHLKPHRLQNDGVTAAESSSSNGFFLTVDMCPSSKPFAKNFFEALVHLAQTQHHPIPIALAVSGRWMINHTQELQWLIKQKPWLAITWMNHTFSHSYYPDLPIEKNFFLHAQAPNLTEEVLATEKILLEHGQIPSVFFRFPGLVSNQKLMETLNQLGLIPVGSNAWLAKGEIAKKGSIILVHGNGNEPAGIDRFMQLLNQNPTMQWLPLAQLFGRS
jgi:hypothetical protein